MTGIDDEVVELSGSLDARSTSEIRSTLHALLERPGRLIVLDLSAVTSADVVALRVIAATSRLAALRGGRVVLRGVAAPIRRLLTVSRLARLVEIEGAPEEIHVPRPRAAVDVSSDTPETA